MSELNDADLSAEALAIAAKATAGPWDFDKSSVHLPDSPDKERHGDSICFDTYIKAGDAEFIAYARTALPELAERLQNCAKERNSLEQHLELTESDRLSWFNAAAKLKAEVERLQSEYDLVQDDLLNMMKQRNEANAEVERLGELPEPQLGPLTKISRDGLRASIAELEASGMQRLVMHTYYVKDILDTMDAIEASSD